MFIVFCLTLTIVATTLGEESELVSSSKEPNRKEFREISTDDKLLHPNNYQDHGMSLHFVNPTDKPNYPSIGMPAIMDMICAFCRKHNMEECIKKFCNYNGKDREREKDLQASPESRSTQKKEKKPKSALPLDNKKPKDQF